LLTIKIEQAQTKLAELIDTLSPGEEASITRDGRAIARLIVDRVPRAPRRPGNCKGMLTIVSDDEDHLYSISFGSGGRP